MRPVCMALIDVTMVINFTLQSHWHSQVSGWTIKTYVYFLHLLQKAAARLTKPVKSIGSFSWNLPQKSLRAGANLLLHLPPGSLTYFSRLTVGEHQIFSWTKMPLFDRRSPQANCGAAVIMEAIKERASPSPACSLQLLTVKATSFYYCHSWFRSLSRTLHQVLLFQNPTCHPSILTLISSIISASKSFIHPSNTNAVSHTLEAISPNSSKTHKHILTKLIIFIPSPPPTCQGFDAWALEQACWAVLVIPVISVPAVVDAIVELLLDIHMFKLRCHRRHLDPPPLLSPDSWAIERPLRKTTKPAVRKKKDWKCVDCGHSKIANTLNIH